jgi:hypothetical protein
VIYLNIAAANSVDIASAGTAIGTTVFTVTSTDQENDQLFYNMTCTPVTCPFRIFDCDYFSFTSSFCNPVYSPAALSKENVLQNNASVIPL